MPAWSGPFNSPGLSSRGNKAASRKARVLVGVNYRIYALGTRFLSLVAGHGDEDSALGIDGVSLNALQEKLARLAWPQVSTCLGG